MRRVSYGDGWREGSQARVFMLEHRNAHDSAVRIVSFLYPVECLQGIAGPCLCFVGILRYRDGERRALAKTRRQISNVILLIKPLFAHGNGICGSA